MAHTILHVLILDLIGAPFTTFHSMFAYGTLSKSCRPTRTARTDVHSRGMEAVGPWQLLRYHWKSGILHAHQCSLCNLWAYHWLSTSQNSDNPMIQFAPFSLKNLMSHPIQQVKWVCVCVLKLLNQRSLEPYFSTMVGHVCSVYSGPCMYIFVVLNFLHVKTSPSMTQ